MTQLRSCPCSDPADESTTKWRGTDWARGTLLGESGNMRCPKPRKRGPNRVPSHQERLSSPDRPLPPPSSLTSPREDQEEGVLHLFSSHRTHSECPHLTRRDSSTGSTHTECQHFTRRDSSTGSAHTEEKDRARHRDRVCVPPQSIEIGYASRRNREAVTASRREHAAGFT